MKKILSVVLALVMIFALTACGGGTKDSTKAPADEKIVIKYSHVQGISTPTHKAAEWLKAVHNRQILYINLYKNIYIIKKHRTSCCFIRQ